MQKEVKNVLIAGSSVAVASLLGYLAYKEYVKSKTNKDSETANVPAPPINTGSGGQNRVPELGGDSQSLGQNADYVTVIKKQTPSKRERCGGIGYWPRIRGLNDVRSFERQFLGRETVFSKSRSDQPAVPVKLVDDGQEKYSGNWYIVAGKDQGVSLSPIAALLTKNGPRWPNNQFLLGDVVGYDANGNPCVGSAMHNGQRLGVIGFEAVQCPMIGEASQWRPIFGDSAGWSGGLGYNRQGVRVTTQGNELPGEPGVLGYWVPRNPLEEWLFPRKIRA